MADKEIKIAFPEQKLEALNFFMAQRNETIEGAMKEFISKTYEKTVPAPVRLFMDRDTPEVTEQTMESDSPVVSANGAERANEERPSRRNQRTQRSEAVAPAPARVARRNQRGAAQTEEPDVSAGRVEDVALEEEQEPEQEQDRGQEPEETETFGMTMGM